MDQNTLHERFAEAAEYYAGRKGSRPTLEQEDTVALLRETQEIYGHIPPQALETISICTGYKVPLLEKLIRLYPSLKLGAAAHEIVVCSGRALRCEERRFDGPAEKGAGPAARAPRCCAPRTASSSAARGPTFRWTERSGMAVTLPRWTGF